MKQGKVFEKWVYWSNYMISFLGIHNQINRCVMFSHMFERLHLGSRCISSHVGPNWFKSHDVAAASAFPVPKCWRFGYCLELTRWVPARKVLEFDHCIGSSGPLHWRGRLGDWGCTQVRMWVEPTHGQQRSRWCLSERKDSDLWGKPPVVKSEFE